MNTGLHTVGVYVNKNKEIINLIYNPFGVVEKINSVLEITNSELEEIKSGNEYKKILQNLSIKYLD